MGMVDFYGHFLAEFEVIAIVDGSGGPFGYFSLDFKFSCKRLFIHASS